MEFADLPRWIKGLIIFYSFLSVACVYALSDMQGRIGRLAELMEDIRMDIDTWMTVENVGDRYQMHMELQRHEDLEAYQEEKEEGKEDE